MKKQAEFAAFLFYVDDWLSSKAVKLMDAYEERGFLRLLLNSWKEPDCGLPDDDMTLATLSELGPRWYRETTEKALRRKGVTSGEKIRACFFVKDGRLYNSRLSKEREHQIAVRLQRAKAGKQGGRPKKANESDDDENQLLINRFSDDNQTGKQNETSPSPKPSFTRREVLEGVENQSSGDRVSSGPPVEIRAVIRNGRTPEYRFLRDKSYLAVVAVAREFWPDSMDEDFDKAFYTWEKFDWEQKKQLTDNLKAKQENEPGRGRFVKKSFREYIDSIEWKRPARPAASAKNGNGSGSEDVSYPYVPDLKHPEEEDNATTH